MKYATFNGYKTITLKKLKFCLLCNQCITLLTFDQKRPTKRAFGPYQVTYESYLWSIVAPPGTSRFGVIAKKTSFLLNKPLKNWVWLATFNSKFVLIKVSQNQPIGVAVFKLDVKGQFKPRKQNSKIQFLQG